MVVADGHLDVRDLKPESFRCHNCDYRARPGAEVLAAHTYFHGAVGLNGHLGVAIVSAAAPGV